MFPSLLQDSTAKLMRMVLPIVAVGILFLIIGNTEYLGSQFPLLSAIYPVVHHLGAILIAASVVLFVLDIRFRKEFISDLEGVLDQKLAARGISEFKLQRKDFSKRITDDIESAPAGSVIKIVGVTQKPFFTDSPGYDLIVNKIKHGCHFRVLIFHPQSSLVQSYENLSKWFGSPNLRLSLTASAIGSMRQIAQVLTPTLGMIEGSIEIRMLNELFSTIYLYRGPNLVLVGFYLAQKRGILSPALAISDLDLAKTFEDHFEALWKLSKDNVLYSIDPSKCEDNTDLYFSAPPVGTDKR
jgi:hypothetical protein